MPSSLSEIDIIIRLCLAFLAGGIIGFERSSRRQVAGLRTHILISVGASCLMLLSIWLPQYFNSGDPGRIAAQVVTGMGFLGAGAIIKLGNDVRGLTTAASLWVVSAIGMAIGAGMYIAAGVAEILTLAALVWLNKIERKIFPDIRNKLLEIHYNHNDEPDTDIALEVFKSFGVKNQSMSIHHGKENGKKTKVRFLVSILETTDINKFAKALKASGNIDQVEIKEKF
ncbi:MAG: MgtC/SapB family protein [Treponema sp.]|nr:MgtC/SapB family protein [Treponema sp.]MCL2252041.1 MgtC/SapB family protein [Treponema sp.]